MQYGKKKKAFYFFTAFYKQNENNEEKLKILDKDFIKKNKNICKIIYKNKIHELKEYFEDIDIKYNHKDLIKFKLIFIHNIIDISYMFYNCDSLISLSDNNEIDLNASDLQININKMHRTFDGCRTLISLPDISKWNISNVMDMVGMFRDCYSLISLPDISKWNTSNVKNMKYMFSGCLSLTSLPDISKWNTSNANDIRGLFYECISLKSLPDLFNWNTSNVNNMRNMFYKCKSLSYLPDFCILNKGISYIPLNLHIKIRKIKKIKLEY